MATKLLNRYRFGSRTRVKKSCCAALRFSYFWITALVMRRVEIQALPAAPATRATSAGEQPTCANHPQPMDLKTIDASVLRHLQVVLRKLLDA